MGYFVGHVDVDGDGAHTAADAAAFRWWIENGGDLGMAIASAQALPGPLYDVSGFFGVVPADPGLVPAVAQSSPALPVGQGGSNDPCDIEVVVGIVSNTPPTATVEVDPNPLHEDPMAVPPVFDTFIEAISRAGANFAATGVDQVISVLPGTYQENIDIDLSAFSTSSFLSGMLTIYASAGPESTIIDGGGMEACLNVRRTNTSPLPPGVGPVLRWGLTLGDNFGPGTTVPSGHAGWLGFTLTNGGVPNGSGLSGGGIRIRGLGNGYRVELRGNIVSANAPSAFHVATRGGGIFVELCGMVQILLNEIVDNRAIHDGAGVHILRSTVELAKNWIHLNAADGTQPTQRGMGVYAVESDIVLCDNAIFNNVGRSGIGLFVHMEDTLGSSSFSHPSTAIRTHIEGNLIRDNTAFPTGNASQIVQGGGIKVEAVPGSASGGPWDLLVLRNTIHGNDLSTAMNTPLASGGGLYLDVNMDPWSFAPGAHGQPLIVGNMISGNAARAAAGGAYLGLFSPNRGVFAKFWNNTIAGNQVDLGNESSGLLLPLDSVTGSYSLVDGVNNIAWTNVPPGGEWLAECDPLVPPPPAWRHCVMPQLSPACATDGYDLFGANCTDDNPQLSTDVFPILTVDSNAAGDDGDDTLGVASITPVDINGTPRSLEFPTDSPGPIDIGADEYFPEDIFIRGDANNDQNVDIADPVRVLSFLFPPPGSPPVTITCMDAADANDDGSVNIADAIAILSYLFGMPPMPLPPPHPCCGMDPTTIDVFRSCAYDTQGCPNPCP